MANALRYDIIADPRPWERGLSRAAKSGDRFSRTVARNFDRSGDEGGRRFGVRFNKRLGAGFSASTKIATVAAGVIGGAFAAVQIGGFLKDAIEEAQEAAKVGRQTAAVIKATGGAAKVTARDVDRLATALSNKVGVDDEIIAAGANMLLTFKGVRNEVGRNNDIFNQASAVILDMTAALHQGEVSQQGLEKATIQVGKALNDPIKGITALQRVGVTFTKAQKEQIATLVESGRTMDAQKIILAELASEFGGAAKAAADPWARVGVVMGNLKEDIGTLLLPAINNAATFIGERLVPAVRGFADKHGPAFGRAFSNVRDRIGEMIAKARAWWETHGPAVKQAFDDARVAVFGVRGELDKTKKAWDDNATAIMGVVGSTKELTGPGGLPTLTQLMKGAGEEVRGTIQLLGLAARAYKFLADGSTTAAKLQVDAVKFVAKAIQGLVNVALAANHKMIAGAATVAEALHLPMAGALRKAEQRMGQFRADFNTEANKIIGKSGDTAANAPGGSKSKFDRSLGKAGEEMVRFRQGFNNQIAGLHDKTVNVKARAAVEIADSTRMYLRAAQVPGFHATGGAIYGPGTGTSDSVPAMLSTGEHVWTAAEVRKAGGHGAVEAMRQEVRGYAAGGAVVKLSADRVPNLMSQFFGPTLSATGRVGRLLADKLATLIGTGLSKAIEKAAGGGSPAIKAFIKRTDPLPYVWGGAGPGGYDCSGLVGAVHLAHLGRAYGHGQRLYTTSTIGVGSGGLKPGLGGTLQIGVTPGRGHMAGRYGGLGFEAESTRTGIKTGAAASRPEGFARHYHLAQGGAIEEEFLAALARTGKLDIGGDRGKLRINGQVFDRGGYLMPGITVAHNRTGKPERVPDPNEPLIDYDRLATAMVQALRREPLTAVVSASAFQAGMNAHAGRMGQARPYR